MNLSKAAIDNYRLTLIIILLLVISGVVSFLTMPRSEDPQVAPAGASIIAIYPGAGPTDMEEQVVDPIEEKLNELDNIKRIESTSSDNVASVAIEFAAGTDMDDSYAKIVQKVNSIRNDLPKELLELRTDRWQLSDHVIILQLALISETATVEQLDRESDRLKKMLDRNYGVKRVKIWALPQRQVRISLDLGRLAQRRIPLGQVISAVEAANSNIPGGSIDVGENRFVLRGSGSFQNLDEIGAVVVQAYDDKVVFLKDLADIRFSEADTDYLARFNGRRAVFVTVNQKEQTNILRVMRGVTATLQDFRRKLPDSITVETAFDQGESVRGRLGFFFGNFLQGLFLVGAVILFSMGFRASIIIMLIIPTSIFIAIGFIDLSGFGLEQMTVTGLVIALGMIVDNAIVVTDNIARFLKQGAKPVEAAVAATRQMSWAITSSTLTTVFAFLPIAMMGDTTGEYIRSMPVIVVYTLLASLLISLTLTPFLAGRFLRPKPDRLARSFQSGIERFTRKIYQPVLDAALRRPKRTVLIALAVFAASLSLFRFINIAFFPKAEKPQLVININTPEGTNLERTDAVARYVESILQKETAFRRFSVNVGRGNPTVHYSIESKEPTVSHAQILAELKSYEAGKVSRLVESLREQFDRYPGARIEVKELEQGPPVEAPIAIKILGNDLEQLRRLSLDVEQVFLAVPGTVNVANPLKGSKVDLRIRVNKAKAGMLGIPLAAIDRTVRAGMAGVTVTRYRDKEGKEYDVVLRLPVQGKPALEDLERIYLTSVTGSQIPLSQVAQITLESSPKLISHYKFSRTVTIAADVKRGFATDKVTRAITDRLQQYPWPSGYEFHAAGEIESREESFGGMGKAMLIALFAIFAILVFEYHSFAQPLIVLSTIPLAVTGSIITLFLLGIPFSFTAFIGLTSLFGIVVNNSIILVEYANQLRTMGKNVLEAIREAGTTRLTPIFLTTATTIGGLLPLALRGGTMYAPMAWTLVGGLTVSTVLTLVVTPTLYLLFSRKDKTV